jgi:hypothetical protein
LTKKHLKITEIDVFEKEVSKSRLICPVLWEKDFVVKSGFAKKSGNREKKFVN